MEECVVILYPEGDKLQASHDEERYVIQGHYVTAR
jgi:hypothetical protein